MNNLPLSSKRYILWILFMSAIFGMYMFNNYSIISRIELMLFIILSILVESYMIKLPNGGAVSVGYAITFTAMIILGPLGAAISCSIGVMLRYVKLPSGSIHHIFNTPLHKTIFNGAQAFISIGIASIVYYSFAGKIADILFYKNIIPLIISICVYVLLNVSIITKLLSAINKQSFIKMFIKNVTWLLPNCFIIASLGIFLSILYLNYGTIIMLLFFGPLLLARHSFKLYLEMKEVYIETVYALSKAVEAKDQYTNGHSQRVAEYAEKLGKSMNIADEKIETLKIAAMLHDIGKIGIRDDVLNKPTGLTDEEFESIKKHPEIGVEILSSVDFLKDAREIIINHHEKYDGTGYPSGLKEDNVPIESYILSVADAFDAMTSDRSYRKGMSVEQALNIIKKDAGTHFEPRVAEKFIELIKKDIKEQEVLQNRILKVQSVN